MVIFGSAFYLSCSFVHGHASFGGSVNVSVPSDHSFRVTEKAMCSNCHDRVKRKLRFVKYYVTGYINSAG
jgi:hypothetical protein